MGRATAEARQARALAWEEEPVRTVRERYTAVLTVVAGIASATSLYLLWSDQVPAAVIAAAVIAVCAFLIVRLNSKDGVDNWAFTRGVVVRLLHGLLLVTVVGVGLMLPSAALYFGTEVSDVLQIADYDLSEYPDARQLVTARALQYVLIGVLTLLPALLYFQFDRERVETLLDRWLHHIFRFDPSLKTLDDVDARYGRRLEEVYGTTVGTVAGSPSQRGRSRSPVVLATLLIGLGWVLVLVNTEAAGSFQSLGELPRVDELFYVSNTPVSFAFLGAYLYSLQVVLRGYVRGDLRPKTYAAISVRIVIALVLAWAVQGILAGVLQDSRLILGMAFLAGVVPDTVLRYVADAVGGARRRATAARDAVGGALRKGAEAEPDVDELADSWPLTALVGIDLYERTRLAEEGITNVQALAHHDVVDLTLSTRIPFERVVHWVDQAVLYEHVSGPHRAALRGYGICTATSLVRAAEHGPEQMAVLDRVLKDGRASVVLAAMQRAEWLPHLLAWREWETERRTTVVNFPATPVEPVDVDLVRAAVSSSAAAAAAPEQTGGQHDVLAGSRRKQVAPS